MNAVGRIAQLAILGALASSIASCKCPDPITIDQVFLLDATSGGDGGQPPSLDCTSTATGCVPGGPCRPACDCVLARDHVFDVGSVQSCTLVAGAGQPEVAVRYQQTVFCGGD